MIEIFEPYWWILLILLVCVFILLDAYMYRKRNNKGIEDSERMNALEKHRLVVVPPLSGDVFHVIRKTAADKQSVFVGVGGKSAREAIDSALLEITPPARRATEAKIEESAEVR